MQRRSLRFSCGFYFCQSVMINTNCIFNLLIIYNLNSATPNLVVWCHKILNKSLWNVINKKKKKRVGEKFSLFCVALIIQFYSFDARPRWPMTVRTFYLSPDRCNKHLLQDFKAITEDKKPLLGLFTIVGTAKFALRSSPQVFLEPEETLEHKH